MESSENLNESSNAEQSHQLRRRDFWNFEQAAMKLKEYKDSWYPDKNAWEERADNIRKCMLKGMGFEVMPDKTPLNPIVRQKRIYDGYTVENVAFESFPGFFCVGNLYKPEPMGAEPHAAIIRFHGHGEFGRYEEGFQRHCGTLARMGAVVLGISMVGYNDSTQYPHKSKVTMALQLWNGIRAIDFLTGLEGVDVNNIGVTGESGGGTQTFQLAAIDPRVKVSIPVVMVSATFFGGCSCESGMPIHVSSKHDTCNVELAAMHAPKPLLIISDGKDWTQNVPVLEFPYIKSVYESYNKLDNVKNVHLALEGHDYGPSKRNASYEFFVQHFKLDKTKLAEEKITVESPEALAVFNDSFSYPEHALSDHSDIERLIFKEQ